MVTHVDLSTAPRVDPDQAFALWLGGEGAYFIDVRQPEDYAAGHIPGAHPMPLRRLARGSAELPRNTHIVLY